MVRRVSEPEPSLVFCRGTYEAGTYTVKVRGGTFSFKRPYEEPTNPKTGAPLLNLDSPTVQVACKLFAKTGQWPAHFIWAVGWPIPSRFRKHASFLALQHVQTSPPEPRWPEAARKVREAQPQAAFRAGNRLVVLPTHECRPGDGTSCGPVDAEMRATCTTRRAFRQVKKGNERGFVPVDSMGCGAVFVLNHYGIRVRV